MSDYKIGIAIPHTGTINAKTVLSLIALLKYNKHDNLVYLKEGCYIHNSREELVKKAILDKCTHILFIDSDMFFEETALERLLARGKDIIGVHYNRRTTPLESTAKISIEERMKAESKKGLVLAQGLGTGFLLINTKVFDKIKHPWFFYEQSLQGDLLVGEDYWFCKRAIEAGLKVWCDMTVLVKHVGNYLY
jgi:hypothetical protein